MQEHFDHWQWCFPVVTRYRAPSYSDGRAYNSVNSSAVWGRHVITHHSWLSLASLSRLSHSRTYQHTSTAPCCHGTEWLCNNLLRCTAGWKHLNEIQGIISNASLCRSNRVHRVLWTCPLFTWRSLQCWQENRCDYPVTKREEKL